jgi:hypothetical protein
VFTYEIEGIEIEKTVFMIYGENSTVVYYRVTKNNHPESPKNLRLELRPLIAFRDYHSTTHQNGALNSELKEEAGLTAVTPTKGCLRSIWPTTPLNRRRAATGTGILSMTRSANAALISRKTFSIPASCVLT